MIDHTGLKVSNPSISRKFYEQALAPLGYKMMMEVSKEYTEGLAYSVMEFHLNLISGSQKGNLIPQEYILLLERRTVSK
jgi:hypothetical protein